MASGIEPTDEFASFVQDLHDSEINAEIGWFFDGVWCVKIGDKRNGYKDEASLRSLGEAAEWLRSRAVELYPDSEFAKDWRRAFE